MLLTQFAKSQCVTDAGKRDKSISMNGVGLPVFHSNATPSGVSSMPNDDQLSPGQRVVLEGLASGLTVKELAFKTGLTMKSVDSHKYRLMQRLGLHNRIELTRYAIENGIVPVMELDDAPEPSQLTDRQREVIALTGAGLSVREMAKLLQISTRAADAHKHKAMFRLDLHDAVRVVHYCVRHDLTAAHSIPDSAHPDRHDASRDSVANSDSPTDVPSSGSAGAREDDAGSDSELRR